MLADPDQGGELVDAFLADQGRIHVGDQEALLPPRQRLHDHVDRLAGDDRLDRRPLGPELADQDEVGGDVLAEQAPALDAGEGLRRPVDHCFAERTAREIGDQRGDKDGRHADSGGGRGPGLRRALLIAGPTASGKSAAALELAKAFGAMIVNSDSMQVYADLRILTARPTLDEEASAPHRLFGEIDGAVNYSVGAWSRRAREILAEIGERPVVFVGGTGLYFRALTEGLSDMPAVPAIVRERTRAEAEGRATADLHAELAALDPATAARVRPSDRQRTLRALEVLAATGRPLASFQGPRGAPAFPPGGWTGLFLAPDRGGLYSRIDARFDAMLEKGALDEAAALMRRCLDPALPVMRALGVRQLIAHIEGRLSLAGAGESAKLETRRYAKRQFTWARHQLPCFKWVAPEAAVDEGTRALRKTIA
jgi:tRNA dimethylallyltransferase